MQKRTFFLLFVSYVTILERQQTNCCMRSATTTSPTTRTTIVPTTTRTTRTTTATTTPTTTRTTTTATTPTTTRTTLTTTPRTTATTTTPTTTRTTTTATTPTTTRTTTTATTPTTTRTTLTTTPTTIPTTTRTTTTATTPTTTRTTTTATTPTTTRTTTTATTPTTTRTTITTTPRTTRAQFSNVVFDNLACTTSCTATLVFDRTQGSIAAPTKSACPTTTCPGGNSVEYLPRGEAAFDVQQNAQCASPCVCDTSNLCYQPTGVTNGNILVRLTTQCPDDCATSADGCTIQAFVLGTSPRTTGCFALEGTKRCHHQIDDMFNVKYVACDGCPDSDTLTCGGLIP